MRYDRAALFEALAHGQRQRAVLAQFTGRRTAYREMSVIRAGSVATRMRRFYETHAWVPRSMDVQRCVLPLELPFDEMLLRINEFRPDLLAGYGSHLGALLRWAWEQGRDLHRPRVIWYGADAMPPADRDLIESRLGIPVLSTYQADEALRIGFQCERRAGFHLSLDDVAVRRKAWWKEVAPAITSDIAPLHYARIVRDTSDAVNAFDPQASLVCDTGFVVNSLAAFYTLKSPWFATNNQQFGQMGFAPPGVIGAGMERKQHPVVVFVGDQSSSTPASRSPPPPNTTCRAS